jgi:hypothetical protein
MYTNDMKLIILLTVYVLSLFSADIDRCQELYQKANTDWIKLQPVLKVNIPSKTGWDLIHAYLDSATLTIAECEPDMKLDFRYIRELKQGMQQADKKRSAFKTQTYRQMRAQAKREGKCTLIYRQYGK